MHSINAQTSQEGFECTKAKEYISSYCPNIIYTVDSMNIKKLLNSHDELGMQNTTSLSRKPSNLNIPSTIKTQMKQVG